MTDLRRFFRVLSLPIFLALILTACSKQPERLWLKSPGWSRAQLIGNTRVGDPVPIAIDSDGNVYIFFVSAENSASHLRVAAFDKQMEVLWDRTYDEIDLTTPSMPRIQWHQNALQLFWIDADRLYSAKIANTGELVTAPMLLSGNELVEHYDVAGNSFNQIAVWYAGSRNEPGLFSLPLGDLTGDPILVDDNGIHPELQFDHSGTLHVIWARYPPGAGDKPFLYAAYPEGYFSPGHESIVVTPRIVGTSILEGPKIGLGSQHAYIFWSMIFLSGEEAGTAETYYVTFPAGQPRFASSGFILGVPYSYELPHQKFPESPLKAGPRIPIGPGLSGRTYYVTQVEINPTIEDELVITMQPWMGYIMRKTKPQVTAAFFQDGEPVGYQILSFTPSNSTFPAIFSDGEDQLYSTWLEKGELPGWAIYLSSTAPNIKDVLDELTSDDIGRLSADVAFGFLTGALLIPIGLAWILPSMLILALSTRVLNARENLTSIRSIISTFLALIVLWVVKLGILPGMRTYVPFSAWIPILPDWSSMPLRIGIPLLIAIFSLLVAWYILQRRKESSIFTLVLIYGVVDSVLTLGVYGVLVFAGF
jgi:hypothetical protein